MLSAYLSSLCYMVLTFNTINGTPWIGPIPQELFKYDYGAYWGQDHKSCIVTDATAVTISSSLIGVPSLQPCNGKYQLTSKKIVLPRNTMPMCTYEPFLVDTSAINYKLLIEAGLFFGNSTFKNYKKQCLEEIGASSKARFKQMYGVNINDNACNRYGELMAVAYGTDPEIKKIADKIEGMISDNLKWRNTKFQANIIISGTCIATNREGCIELWRHLFEEKDNSYLNLLGNNYQGTPTTWIYADGIDIELLHPLAEIMGMDIQTNVAQGIYYHHISPNAPSGDYVKRKAGLVGGFPNSQYLK